MNLKKENDEKLSFFSIMIITAIDILVFMLNGYVLQSIYNWFIHTTLNLPQMTLPVATGIILISSFIFRNRSENVELGEAISTEICRPVLFLIIAYTIKLILL